MFTATLCIIAPNRKQPNYASTDKLINVACFIYRMAYYSATHKMNQLLINALT